MSAPSDLETLRAQVLLGDPRVARVPLDGWIELESTVGWIRRSFTPGAMNAAENAWSGHADALLPKAGRAVLHAAIEHDLAHIPELRGVEVDWDRTTWTHELDGHQVTFEAPATDRQREAASLARAPEEPEPTECLPRARQRPARTMTEAERQAALALLRGQLAQGTPLTDGLLADRQANARREDATLRGTLYASLEDHHPVYGRWKLEHAPGQHLLSSGPDHMPIAERKVDPASIDAERLEAVIDRATQLSHQLAADAGIGPDPEPRARLHTARMEAGRRGDLYISARVHGVE